VRLLRRREALIALAASAAGCGLPDTEYFGRVPDVRTRGQHLRFCNSGEPESLDPATSSSTTAMKPVYLLFDGLTDYDPNGLPEPSLATSWDVSDDIRRFTFHLHDKGRWSNGRPITARDVRFQAMRVMHPTTAAINATLLVELKNASLYTANKARLVLRDLPEAGLKKGDVVEVVGDAPPDSNLRRGTQPLGLRDLRAAEDQAYARVPAQSDVTIIDVDGDWTYVYWAKGDGVYGWVPAAELDVAPNAEHVYDVKLVPPRQRPGLELSDSELAIPDAPADVVRARGKDLLMTPEVLGLRVPDDHTIVFETANPTPWFVNLSSNRALRPTPIEAVSRWPRRWTDVNHIVTSGPMHLVEWKERDKLELVRSKTYWNQEEVKLDRLTMYAVDDQAAATNLYFTGGCDALTANHVPATFTRSLHGRYKDFTIDPWLGVYFVLVQSTRYPNRHLRRALAYAVDRTAIPKILHGGQFPSAQYMPGTPIAQLTDDELKLCGVTRDTPGVASIMITGELCYVPPPGLDFDPEKARAELAIARQEMGASFPSKLVYKFNQGVEQHKLIAEYLQAQWQSVLGMPIELEVQEWKTFLQDTKNGNYEMGRFGWIGNFPDIEGEFIDLFRCGSANNRSKYCSEEFETALRAAKPIRDRKERLKKVYEAERIVVEDAPVIPLYVYTQTRLTKPYVRDLHINLIDQPPLHEAWIDPDWREHAK
jgi:oligopeptide transport system substrate-binding protein